jgi:signal transduction histidine kinase
LSVLVLVGPGSFRNFRFGYVTLAIALGLMIVGALLARNGLASFNRLRRSLSAIHAGNERGIEGSYPTEIQPLVDDLNVLLANRDHRVREALAKAGDLAHGLKTPLAVLAHEADRAGSGGHHELAAAMRQQIERMQRQMDYHVAHARAAASGATPGVRTTVARSAEGLVRTLERLHAARGLRFDLALPEHHTVRAQREDVDEMLGNLLDNACKWARSRVSIASTADDGRVTITVEDDGPGLPSALRDRVLERGVRADEAAPGFGFGLAIVRDLAELHDGSIVLDDATLGGLRARLQLPAASNVHAFS